MKKLLIAIAAVSTMLVSGVAFSQNKQNNVGGHAFVSLATALSNDGVAYGLARRPTRDAAIAAAIKNCNKANKSGAPCETQETFSRGCAYVTINQHGTQPLGWAASTSVEGLYRRCNEQNMTCKETYSTMCAY